MANTPIRNFRIPEDLWAAVVAKADAEGVTVTAVVTRLLERWVRR